MGIADDRRQQPSREPAQQHPFQQATEEPLAVLRPNAFNPKVPVAALGASQLGELVQWVLAGMGVDMPVNIAYTVGGIIMLIVVYFLPGRAN